MKRILFFMVILITMLSSVVAYSQDCLKLIYPHDPENGFFNPDLVMVDTCSQNLYSLKSFEIRFRYFPFINYLTDTIFVKEQIDSSFITLLTKFNELDSIYGSFIFLKKYGNINDSTNHYINYFKMEFSNYVDINEIINFLNTMDTNNVESVRFLFYPYSQKITNTVTYANQDEFLFGDVDDDRIIDGFHKLSNHWHLFDLKVPLAWQITSGSDEVVICMAGEDFLTPQPTQTWLSEIENLHDIGHGCGDGLFQKNCEEHRDNKTEDYYHRIRITNSNGQQYIQNTEQGNIIFNAQKGENQNVIDYQLSDIYSDNTADSPRLLSQEDKHDMYIHATTIAKLNNKGIVGIAPTCLGALTTLGNDQTWDADNLPFLYISDEIKKPVGVIFQSTLTSSSFDKSLKNGLPMIGFSTNYEYGILQKVCKQDGFLNNPSRISTESYFRFNKNFEQELIDNDLQPEINNYSWDSRIDNKDAIANSKFIYADFQIYPEDDELPVYQRWVYNNDFKNYFKYPQHPTKKDYWYTRDLIVPVKIPTLAKDGTFTSTSGPSTSIGVMAGIVGLIRSVDWKAGLPYDIETYKITSRIYNIVTFTATKFIPDYFIRYKEGNTNIYTHRDNVEDAKFFRQIDVGYRERGNEGRPLPDPLDRWWSPIGLYGKPNALRCLMYSIPVKAPYEISSTISLDNIYFFNIREDNRLSFYPNINDVYKITDNTSEFHFKIIDLSLYNATYKYGTITGYKTSGNGSLNSNSYELIKDDNSNNKISFTDFSICHELDSKHFIHFGSKIKEGQWVRELFNIDNGNVKPFNTWESDDPYKKIDINGSGTDNEVLNVLEWGGRHFPGNTTEPWKNNWGETILKGNTTITVPENFVACIDGILRQPTEQYEITSPQYELSANCKFETSGSGKILITGYLRDVKLEGLIKTDDLDIYSSSSNGYGTLTFNSSGTTSENSEIYGIVNVNDDSKIEMTETSDNILIIQPGGEIHFKGSKGLSIPSGATLELAYGAEIRKERSSEIFITIESGGTLKIRKGAAVTIDVPIIVEPGGKLIFEDNTLAWIDEITILENDGTLENGGLVFNTDDTKLGTWLLPAENKTGKVTIMPGTSLYIPEVDKTTHPNVKEIAILGGIEVYGHGEMAFPTPIYKVGSLIVEENSNFTCGPINSSSFTNILFNKGSKISFVSNNADPCFGVSNISINGNLTAVGDASIPIEISGWKGANKYKNTLFPEDTPQVYANISMGSEWHMNMLFSTLPSANFKYVKFTDVTIKTFDSHLEELISCNFLYNSSNFKSYKENENIKNLYSTYKPNALLSVNRLLPVWDPVNFGPNLTLTNCTFKDEAAPVMAWLTAENTPNVPDYDYHLNGVSVQGLRNVTIDNSGLVQLPENPTFNQANNPANHHFWGLNSGISTVNCNRVTITNSNFGYCREAQVDHNSSVKLCQNTTWRVNTAHSLNRSKFWGTFDNKFHQSSKATSIIGVLSGQNFRGNLFDDYFNGIYMNSSRAFLRGDFAPTSGDIFIVGRNEFLTPKLESPYNIMPYPIDDQQNPFAVSTPINRFNSRTRSDIFFENYGDNNNSDYFDGRKPLKIQCGYNKMGEYTPSHLYYIDKKDHPDWPNINVKPNVNNWVPNQIIKYNLDPNNPDNITIIQPNNNLGSSQDRILGCDEPDVISQCEEIVPMVGTCDFFVRNTGNWPFEQNPDVVLDNDFYAYLNDFCNGILSCDCYRQRLFDLVQLATLGDSTDQKLEMIINCILDKLNDPVYNTVLNCNISDLMLNLGESYERRGLFDDALDAYYYVLSNPHNSTDTTLARWRVLNLEAIQQDTAYGFVYDSLMKEYFRRVDYDITRTYIGTGGGNPAPKLPIENTERTEEILPIAELEQNAPNPFTNETVIKFRLNKEADVRLAIHNELGHTVKVLVNQRLMPGNFIYTFFNDGLSSGIYLYLLTTEGKQFTKKMQLVK